VSRNEGNGWCCRAGNGRAWSLGNERASVAKSPVLRGRRRTHCHRRCKTRCGNICFGEWGEDVRRCRLPSQKLCAMPTPGRSPAARPKPWPYKDLRIFTPFYAELMIRNTSAGSEVFHHADAGQKPGNFETAMGRRAPTPHLDRRKRLSHLKSAVRWYRTYDPEHQMNLPIPGLLLSTLTTLLPFRPSAAPP